jgi:RND family efflux transporter MFP subunit
MSGQPPHDHKSCSARIDDGCVAPEWVGRTQAMTKPCSRLVQRVLVITVVALVCTSCRPKAPPPPPPPDVLVTEVRQQDAPIYNEYVGQLDASVNATIQSRVQGYLVSQNYKEGQLVKKDDVLFEIDRRPFEAALAQAKAAFLQADASAKQAEMNAQRAADLFQRKVSSEQERDNATQSAYAARAQAEAQRAAVEQAQLSLDYTTIHAPVDGIAGLVKVQVGDLIGAGTILTTVTKVDPMKAYFTVSEQRFSEYSRRYADPQELIEHEKELRFELILADGSVYPHTGELFAKDNQVDVRTGSLRIAALFPNPGNILRPGQFARIRVLSEIKPGALLVPQRAVSELQGTNQAAVVGPDNKVHIQPVKMGRRIDHEWIVEEGLKAGDKVIVEGIQKAREGAVVNPKPWTPPSPSPAPATR